MLFRSRARSRRFDHAFSRSGARNFDAITAGKRTALAARYAIEDFGTVEFDQVAPAVVADDEAVVQGGLCAQRLLKHNANRRGRGGRRGKTMDGIRGKCTVSGRNVRTGSVEKEISANRMFRNRSCLDSYLFQISQSMPLNLLIASVLFLPPR